MKLQRIPITKITPAPYNPRVDLQPGDEEYDALERSIERWGLVQPLVWNLRTGNLVAGHQRLKIMVARGDEQVDVLPVDLEPEEETALSVALNKISGDWDKPRLFEVLQTLSTQGVDLTLTGFDNDMLADLAGDLDRPLFEPEVAPVMAQREVTERDVQSATRKQEERFAKAKQVRDITCPHCGQSFGV